MLRRAWVAMLPGMVLSMDCLAAGSSLEEWRSNDAIHGLYEIDQAARAFVAAENARSKARWTVAEPNLKTLVARCSVPLDTRWGKIRLFAPDGRELTGRVVEVVCTQPVSGERWTISLRVSSAS